MSATRPTLRDAVRGDTGAWVARGVLVLVGVFVLAGGLGYGVTDTKGLVGAGFIPMVAGLLIVLATGVDILNALRFRRAGEPTADVVDHVALIEASGGNDADEVDVFGRSENQRGRAVLVIFALIALAAVAAYLIGLLLSLSLLVAVLVGLVERKPWWAALAGGVVAFLFGYVVFGVALQVPLPTGLLGLI